MVRKEDTWCMNAKSLLADCVWVGDIDSTGGYVYLLFILLRVCFRPPFLLIVSSALLSIHPVLSGLHQPLRVYRAATLIWMGLERHSLEGRGHVTVI